MFQSKFLRKKIRRQNIVRLLAGTSCICAGLFIQAFESQTKPTTDNRSSAIIDPKTATEQESANDPNAENASQRIGGSFQNQGYRDPREELTNERHAFKTPFGQVQWKDIEKKITVKDRSTFANYKGYNLKLTIQPEVQAALDKILASQRNIAGAIVILESRTGRILAMSETRADSRSPLVTEESILVTARAPAASLMKIVTATAAIEKNGLDPDQEIPFHGGCGNLRNRNWLRDAQADRQHMSFSHAFGVSCNTVFARLALYETGLATLRQYAEKYMFNRPIPSDLRIETSAALMPALEMATALEVGEAGAGLVPPRSRLFMLPCCRLLPETQVFSWHLFLLKLHMTRPENKSIQPHRLRFPEFSQSGLQTRCSGSCRKLFLPEPVASISGAEELRVTVSKSAARQVHFPTLRNAALCIRGSAELRRWNLLRMLPSVQWLQVRKIGLFGQVLSHKSVCRSI